MRTRALQYLRTALNNPSADFHAGQWEAINGILQNQRQLVVQKTGWGKSMVYFLGTRLLRDQAKGPTLLISPLLSLMRNQIAAAARIGIRAATINSSNNAEWPQVEARLRANEIDVLLISPERLANDTFQTDVLQRVANRIGLFVVDEAHCISDWGHDFRPDYRRIIRVLQALPTNIPILATTATANNRVVADVAGQLGALNVVRGPLIRESLVLQNISLPSPAARYAWIAEHLRELPGSGIIYTLTVRDAQRLTEWLKQKGYNVEAYHSRLEDDEAGTGPGSREVLEDRLLSNNLKALVSTVALGMGFDKPDMGFVVHFQRPGSVVHYYQQVGRAGRALENANGIMLSGEEDERITEFFIRTAFPPQAHIDAVLSVLASAPGGLSVPRLEQQVNLSKGNIEKVLKILATEVPSPLAKIGSNWNRTPVPYTLDQAKVQALVQLRSEEQQTMSRYLHATTCLMQFLGRELDDGKAQPCGKCANCVGRAPVCVSVNQDLAREATNFLNRNHQHIKSRKQWPRSFEFEDYPFTGLWIGDNLLASEGRALCLWGDPGWAELVRQGKYETGTFANELVDACAEMIRTWHPTPAPTWVTCIPSRRHPELVAGFSRRLAERLRIPFRDAVRKVRDNSEQKLMMNSTQQVKNLDGAFAIDRPSLATGPVLLIDDMIDSGWTFTIAAALLRQAGCPAVFPMALAVTSQGSA